MNEAIIKPEIIKPENLVYKPTDLMVDTTLSYCPGCGHGTVHRLLMEVIREKAPNQKGTLLLYAKKWMGEHH